MNFVQPIRDKKKIQEMKVELKKQGTRNYLLFMVGINTGLRISDLIKLQVQDVMNYDRTPKIHIDIIEEKTEKRKIFKINDILSKEFYNYTKNMEMTDFLFKSRKGQGHIGRVEAYRIIKGTGEKIGLNDIGTHTLRKTFGYHFYYDNGKYIVMLQKIFNHSSPSITKRYIGVSQDEIDTAYTNFSL